MELIKENIPLILSTITGVLAWFFERNKRRQELKVAEQKIQETETKHQQQVVDLYQEALTDLKSRYDEKFMDLKRDYTAKFDELEEEMKSLKTNLELWKTKYRNLKQEFDNYKSRKK